MARWPWFERKFQFDYPPTKFPELLERVRGTPARLEERLRNVDDDTLSRSDGRGWSIKQNVGHLVVVEALHVRRLEQLLAGEANLVAADLTNRATNEGQFNSQPGAALLRGFRTTREAMVGRFAEVPEADWGRAGLHPRLQQPMRIVDILCFTAEHDDYHLGRIAELLRNLGRGRA
jgi:uncharacterized damage-inducible protein DinB